MLEKDTYEEWTDAFNTDSGSTYEGDWNEGSTLRFIGKDPADPTKVSGMISRVAKNIPNEFISLESTGMIMDGVDDTTSDMVKGWLGALENYTFKDVDGGTEVSVDQDTDDAFVEEFSAMWPKGLAKLKEICER